MSPDKVSKEEQQRLEEIDSMLLAARALGKKVLLMTSEEVDRFDIFSVVSEELDNINKRMSACCKDAQFFYSGEAFVPVYDDFTDVRHTAYKKIERRRGRFGRFAIRDAIDMSYISDEYLDDEADDEDDVVSGGLNLLVTDSAKDSMELFETVAPKLGPRLYAYFIEGRIKNDEEDQEVGGSAVCSRDTVYYNILDVETLKIEYVEIANLEDVLPIDRIVPEILTEAKRVKHLKRDTAFRRLGTEHQIDVIEKELADLNGKLGLERVEFHVLPEYVYSFVPEQGFRTLMKCELDPELDQFDVRLPIKPDKIDSIELYNLTFGVRICNNKRMIDPAAGLCLVGRIDERLAEIFHLPSPVIWVPLADLQPDRIFAIPNGFYV